MSELSMIDVGMLRRGLVCVVLVLVEVEIVQLVVELLRAEVPALRVAEGDLGGEDIAELDRSGDEMAREETDIDAETIRPADK